MQVFFAIQYASSSKENFVRNLNDDICIIGHMSKLSHQEM